MWQVTRPSEPSPADGATAHGDAAAGHAAAGEMEEVVVEEPAANDGGDWGDRWPDPANAVHHHHGPIRVTRT